MDLTCLPGVIVLHIGGFCSPDGILALERSHRILAEYRMMRLCMAPMLLRRLGFQRHNLTDLPVCFRESPFLYGCMLEEISDVFVYPRSRVKRCYGGKPFGRRCDTCISTMTPPGPLNRKIDSDMLRTLRKSKHTLTNCHHIMRVTLLTYLYLRRYQPSVLALIY